MHSSTDKTLHWLIPVSSAILLWLGFLAYGATGHDDAHINFWSAWTLLEHGSLLNYNGNHVEQTTNLLQDILTAVLHLVSRLDIVTCGFLVDIVSAWGCCWLSFSLAKKLNPAFAGWVILLLASTSSFMLWSFGGMGATLAAWCLLTTVWVWSAWIENPSTALKLKLLLLLVCLALTLERPEMPPKPMKT